MRWKKNQPEGMVNPAPIFWIASYAGARTLARQGTVSLREWCYLGTDSHQRRALARDLASVRSLDIADSLHQTTMNIREEFLDWMAQLGQHQKDKETWHASALASKSPLQTDFFQLVCYAEMIHGWLDHSAATLPLLIVVEDHDLRALLRQALEKDTRLKFSADRAGLGVWNGMRHQWQVLLTDVRFLTTALFTQIAARILYCGKQHPKTGASALRVWIYTWIEDRCFKEPGHFEDPYTTRLQALLRDHHIDVHRLTFHRISLRHLLKLRSWTTDFIIASRYIAIFDIFRAAMKRFQLQISGHSMFRHLDYTVLLRREEWRESTRTEFASLQLWKLTLHHIIQRFGVGVSTVFYPFENQPWEKLFLTVYRELLPTVKLIGYQHSSFGPLYLNYFLGVQEKSWTPLPDQIVAVGPASLALFRNDGYPPDFFVNGGGLRYEYLHQQSFETQRPRSSPPRVLLALPTSYPHAAALLGDLLAQFPNPRSGIPMLEFIIKCHPDLSLNSLLSNRQRLPEGFTVSNRPLHELLRTSDLFLYSPPTTACIEAHIAGLPVLKYRGELLDLDSLDPNVGPATPVCSRQTLREQLIQHLNQPERISGTGQQILQTVFSPVNESLWLRLAGDSHV